MVFAAAQDIFTHWQRWRQGTTCEWNFSTERSTLHFFGIFPTIRNLFVWSPAKKNTEVFLNIAKIAMRKRQLVHI